MLYLLDADTLITGDRLAYPLRRFPIFWDWLCHQGTLNQVKVPAEQFEEVTSGRGELVEWLKLKENRDALLFTEDANPELVAHVTLDGYGDLNENEIEEVGRDPFLISYAIAPPIGQRTVVSFEVSAPGKRRARRKVPDVCRDFNVPCCNLYSLIHSLDFTTNWRP